MLKNKIEPRPLNSTLFILYDHTLDGRFEFLWKTATSCQIKNQMLNRYDMLLKTLYYEFQWSIFDKSRTFLR